MSKKSNCTHLTKKTYLDNTNVKCFVEYLVSLIKDACFQHQYTIANGGKNKAWRTHNESNDWMCKSLRDATGKYFWAGKNFCCNNLLLDNLSTRLKAAAQCRNEKAVLVICLEILDWGGVSNGAYGVAKLYVKDKLICSLEKGLKALTPDDEVEPNLSGFKSGKYIMNASFTKIYSLLSDKPFIIYDSRVAAALCLTVKKYWQSKDPLPDCLRFGWLTGRGNAKRCADKEMFVRIRDQDDQAHALWNMRANWIFEAALRCAYPEEENILTKMRELEAALFMIGYHVTDLSISSSPETHASASERE